jgi:hypothetical protein
VRLQPFDEARAKPRRMQSSRVTASDRVQPGATFLIPLRGSGWEVGARTICTFWARHPGPPRRGCPARRRRDDERRPSGAGTTGGVLAERSGDGRHLVDGKAGRRRNPASAPPFLERAGGLSRRCSAAPDPIMTSGFEDRPCRRRPEGRGPRGRGPSHDTSREGNGSGRSSCALRDIAAQELRQADLSYPEFFALLFSNIRGDDRRVGTAEAPQRQGIGSGERRRPQPESGTTCPQMTQIDEDEPNGPDQWAPITTWAGAIVEGSIPQVERRWVGDQTISSVSICGPTP